MSIFPIVAKIGGNASGFVSAMAAGSTSLKAFAGAAGIAAGGLGVLAGAAAMGAAVKAAVEWQSELVKLNTLVGISMEQIDDWKGSIMELAVETGRAPADLAKAMFAITSGGSRGQEALDLLTQAAKGSAMGLGDMTEIGRLAGAAMIAFGDAGLTAGKSIDVLGAVVRAGNLDAASLAGSFTKVFAPAAALGVSMEEAGAFVATYSRLTGDAAEATTGLYAALTLLIKPSTEARTKMEELGIPIEHLRAVVREDGLNAGLTQLSEAIGDDIDALGEVIPNVRALGAILGTVGVQTESYKQTLDETNASLGFIDEGFQTWSDTSEASFARFKSAATTFAIAVGEMILPPLELILLAITPVIQALAWLVSSLDKVARFVAGDFMDRFQKFLDMVFNVEPDVEAIEKLAGALEDLGKEELTRRLEKNYEKISLYADIMMKGGRGARVANEEMKKLTQINVELEEALVLIALAEAEVGDARTVVKRMTEEQIAAEEKRLDSVFSIMQALEDEKLVLEEGELALIDKTLETLKANDTTREYVAALFEGNKALREEAAAQRDATLSRERGIAQRERQIQQLAEDAKRAQERALDAARDLLADSKLAELQSQLRVIENAARDVGESFATAFDTIIDRSDSVSNAIAEMVTSILRDLSRLMIQEHIIAPFISGMVSQFGPGTTPALTSTDFKNRSKELGRLGRGELGIPGKSAASVGIGTAAVIVQQTIEISPRLIDGRDGARFVREQSGEIARVVRDAVQSSVGYARELQGSN